MTWQHRILATRSHYPHLPEESRLETTFAIYEVYLDETGQPTGYGDPQIVASADDNAEGIRWMLQNMNEALTRPILWATDDLDEHFFPEEYQ
jgi:hypothetical protein